MSDPDRERFNRESTENERAVAEFLGVEPIDLYGRSPAAVTARVLARVAEAETAREARVVELERRLTEALARIDELERERRQEEGA